MRSATSSNRPRMMYGSPYLGPVPVSPTYGVTVSSWLNHRWYRRSFSSFAVRATLRLCNGLLELLLAHGRASGDVQLLRTRQEVLFRDFLFGPVTASNERCLVRPSRVPHEDAVSTLTGPVGFPLFFRHQVRSSLSLSTMSRRVNWFHATLDIATAGSAGACSTRSSRLLACRSSESTTPR